MITAEELPPLREGLSITLTKKKLEKAVNTTTYTTPIHDLQETSTIRATHFSKAKEDEKKLIEEYKYKLINHEKDKLITLHKEHCTEGLLIIIPDNTHVKEPLLITTRYEENGFTHIIIIAKKKSTATITRAITARRTTQFVNEVIEIHAEEGATITYNERQELAESVMYSQKRGVTHRKATQQWYTHREGGILQREETRITLRGEESKATILKTSTLTHNEEEHTISSITHKAPNTTSKMHAKNVIQEKARLLYKGVIIIEEQAGEANGYQQADTLLIGEKAEADVIPELDIKNPHVACSHGATISSINDEELFYLRSRGIDRETAENMITRGFMMSILEHADKEWQEHLQALHERRGKNP